MSVERERLAREILAPLFTITAKIALPIFTVYYIAPIYSYSLIPTIFIFVTITVILVVSSSIFAKAAKKLETELRNLSKSVSSYVKTYAQLARLKTPFWDVKSIVDTNARLACTEGTIDVASQAPRQFLDIIIIFVVVMAATTSETKDLLSAFMATPLLLRSVSSFQSIYKAYASLKSNILALSVTSLPTDREIKIPHTLGKKTKYIKLIFHKEIGKFAYQGQKFNVIGLRFPSGFGKTCAILNLLYETEIFPSKLSISIENIDLDDIGYISSNPYYFENSINSDADRNRIFSAEFLPRQKDPALASAGEKFRCALIDEVTRGAKVIIIDESIVSIPLIQRMEVCKIMRDKDFGIPLIIVSHSEDVLRMCDKVISE